MRLHLLVFGSPSNYGVGATTGGRRFVFKFGRFIFRLRAGVSPGVAFVFVGVARFALAFRFWLAARFALRLPFAFALALLFALAGFFLGLLSFEFVDEFEALVFSGFFAVAVFVFDGVVVEVSPSFVGRLMSTATVCPTLTS